MPILLLHSFSGIASRSASRTDNFVFIEMNKQIFRLVLIILIFSVKDGQAHSFDAVRAAYMAARDGKLSLATAVEHAEAYLLATPNDAAVIAYKGSLRTMQARESTVPWRKMKYIQEGFSLLDAALSQVMRRSPHVDEDTKLEVLIVTGITNANVPKAFGRRPLAARDLSNAALLSSFSKLSPETKSAVYAWLAVAVSSRSEDDARKYLAVATSLDRRTAMEIWSRR